MTPISGRRGGAVAHPGRGALVAGRDPLAWLDAFGGRVDLVVAAADGPRPRSPSPPRSRSPPSARTAAAGTAGRRRHPGLRGRRRPPRRRSPSTAAGRCACSRATAAPPRRRRPRRATASRSCSSATTPATSRSSPLDGSDWPRRVSHADYAWDPAWSADGTHAGVARVGPPEHAVGRLAHHGGRGRRRRRARGVVAGGDDVAVGQPRFSPDRRHARVRVGGRRLDERLARRRRRRRAVRRSLDEPHEHADPSWGPGPAVVRVVARRRRRSCSTATRTASAAWCVVALADRHGAGRRRAGLARRLDWGRGRRRVHPLGRPHRARSSPCSIPRPVPRDRAAPRGAPAELDAVDLPEPTPVTWPGADGATVHGLLWLPPSRRRRPGDGALPPLLVDVHGGPTDQSTRRLEAARALLRVAGMGGAAARTTGARPATAAATGTRSTTVGRPRRRRHRRRHPRRRCARAGPTRRASR